MAFHNSQLGRFGQMCSTLFGQHGNPDLRAAHALASDGVAQSNRPNLQAVLGTKMLYHPADPVWQTWLNTSFSPILNWYQGRGLSPLSGRCTRSWSPMPAGFCMHELTPPLHYWSLRSFVNRAVGTTVHTRSDGTVGVDPAAKPLWNYVVTAAGEILVGSEDFDWIKHTSLAGGLDVWSAGQVGVEQNRVRLVDLQSGHYVGWAILPSSNLANELMRFTEEVFQSYSQYFGLTLHPAFQCIWS